MNVHLFTPKRAPSLAGGGRGQTPSSGARPAGAAAGGRGHEAGALLLCAAALYLCLALAGLRADPNDPSLHGPDYVGPVGAAIAGVLARGFGVVAWLAPIELALLGAPLFRRLAPRLTSLRFAGDLVVAIIAAALVHVALPRVTAFGHLPAGGNVGVFFGELMQALFSTLGSFLVGTTAIGLILIGRSSFSFIEWVEAVSRLLRRFADRIGVLVDRAKQAWIEARALRRERAERDRERALSTPHIDTDRKDEAILAHLEEDDSDWIAIEQTGAPPLSLSKALRESLDRSAAGLADGGDGPVGVTSALSNDGAVETTETPNPSEASEEASERVRAEGADTGSDRVREPAAATTRPVSGRGGRASKPTIVDTRPNQEIKKADARARRERTGDFELPSAELLNAPPPAVGRVDQQRMYELAEKLEKTLSDYGVVGKVSEIQPGPTVTTYEVAPEAGTKVSKIARLTDDLALGLSRTVRIIAPIPGKSVVGFELPNDERVPVSLRELIEDRRFEALAKKAPLPVVLGRDIVGAPFYADLASMPHVIVAGATGAGKSVGLNVMLSSLLFRRTPDELKLLMIDPKVVELAPFDGIPHMLLPVVTDMKQAATALKWAVDEMERRYQLFANAGTKNISTYNRWVDRVVAGEVPAPDPKDVTAVGADGAVVSVPAARSGSDGRSLPGRLPYMVIVVDEFADLMMQQGKEVEASVARLAQKARAAGMHVVLATQRPSVDVITGMIKANFPTRIAYRVSQKVDSRTILDEQGAELLLGKGDMLVKMNGSNETHRVQCPFISEEEVTALTDFLRAQGAPQYHDDILKADEEQDDVADDESLDARFDEAVAIVAETQRCSTSWLQRKMTIGYNRAAKIVEAMERRGMVGPQNGARDREVLLPPPS